MVMKLNKSQLVKVSKQLDGALEALDLLFQYEEGAKLMDDSKIDFSAIVGLRDKVEEMAEKKSRKKRSNEEEGVVERISFTKFMRENKLEKSRCCFYGIKLLKSLLLKLKEVIKFQAMHKYFDGNMSGSSLFGNCLDGKDLGVRLDIIFISDWKMTFVILRNTRKKERITMNREAFQKLIDSNLLGSNDVQEILLINRSRLKALIDCGKLTPIKELKRESLFFLPDVEALKKEMLLDSRTNLYKSAL